MPYYLGIDLGTTGLKTIVTDGQGAIWGSAYQGYPLHTPRQSYAEQDPEDWYHALTTTVRQVLADTGIDHRDIAGIGLSGQMHGTVLLDDRMKLLGPAIIWCDQRSKDEVALVYRQFSAMELSTLVQNPVATGFQLSSLLWLRENDLSTYQRIRHVLLPKDYLRFRLTGTIGTEPSDACGTLLYDVINQVWSHEILRHFGIDERILPDPDHRSCEIAGTLTTTAARELGLGRETCVVFGGGDQPMQAVGNGILTDGRALLTLGTGGQVFVPTGKPLPDPGLRFHTFCHAQANSWYYLGAVLNAGLALNWALKHCFNLSDFGKVGEIAAKSPAGSRGLFFLPYISGERTPHMNPDAKGIFWGLSLGHSREDLIRAVMEGISYSLWDAYECLVSVSGKPRSLIVTGGGANSRLWRQILADMLDAPIFTTDSKETACLGAAICAMVAGGEYPDLVTACTGIIKVNSEPLAPIRENTEVYAEGHALFQDIYRANRHLF
ncbi:MAG: xylulokinase [Clostridiaceae bacterium]|nr:xylulokinase [Clostridiaceae bacterium]